MQNFRQKIFFKTEDQATLELLNDLTGNVNVPQYTVSHQSGKSFGKGNEVNTHHGKTETISWVTRPVIDPQLVRNLMPEHAIALLTIQGHSCDDILNTMYVN